MIVTVTLNPSLDRTLEVSRLVPGEVNRAESAIEDPGGKGVNVARVLAAAGSDALAVLPVGGPIGHALSALLDDAGIAKVAVPIAGKTRANVTVVEPDGTTTKLNEPGPKLRVSEVDAIVAAVAKNVTPGGWVVVAGSLPTGLATDVIVRLGAVAAASDARFALDASGPALRDGLASRPDLIKPNGEELSELLGVALPSRAEVIQGMYRALELGAGAVLCSLGADGALLLDASGLWHANGPAVAVRSTVGAGDSLLAGFLHAGGRGPRALQVGVAWATAAVATPGTGVPDAELIEPDAVEVTAIARPQ
jgi:1-phosphofructokinase